MLLSRLSKLLKKELSFNYSTKLCKVNMSDNNETDSKSSNTKNFESEDKPEWYEAHKLAIQVKYYVNHHFICHILVISSISLLFTIFKIFFFLYNLKKNNQHFYIDPVTGYKVMTELYHKSRGRCCGSKCRHCPFNHENVGKNINLQDLINDDFKNVSDNEKKK